MPRHDVDMELGGHIDELRHRVLISLGSVVLFSTIAFILKENMIEVIFAPSKADFIFNRWMFALSERLLQPTLAINQGVLDIVNTKMAGQFNLHLKASIVAGIVCSMPVILWQLWAFIKPAISANVQRRSDWMILQVMLLFFVGLLFGYTFISPLAINFLVNYNFSDNITNLIEVPSYLSTVINISLAAAFIFQLPHLVFVLSRIGVLSSAAMKKYRRIAIVIIVTISAIITPPDIFSQVLIAIPFYALYECGIIVAQREERRKSSRREC
ncbi:MAG: twin-arginine translocase subunit TatC [Rikenellaceae bacterium]